MNIKRIGIKKWEQAHPQSLQCYGAYPQKDFRHIYLQLAQVLCLNDMYIEESSRLAAHLLPEHLRHILGREEINGWNRNCSKKYKY